MSVEINKVHIGAAIEARRREVAMTKTELARRVCMPQQHVNKMTAKENIDTDRLIKVSEALDFNFFTLYGEIQPNISARIATVAWKGGKANTNVTQDSKLKTDLEKEKEKNKGLNNDIDLLKEQISNLKGQVADFRDQLSRLDKAMKDKDTLIELLKERR